MGQYLNEHSSYKKIKAAFVSWHYLQRIKAQGMQIEVFKVVEDVLFHQLHQGYDICANKRWATYLIFFTSCGIRCTSPWSKHPVSISNIYGGREGGVE